jgi:hypothetical protein
MHQRGTGDWGYTYILPNEKMLFHGKMMVMRYAVFIAFVPLCVVIAANNGKQEFSYNYRDELEGVPVTTSSVVEVHLSIQDSMSNSSWVEIVPGDSSTTFKMVRRGTERRLEQQDLKQFFAAASNAGLWNLSGELSPNVRFSGLHADVQARQGEAIREYLSFSSAPTGELRCMLHSTVLEFVTKSWDCSPEKRSIAEDVWETDTAKTRFVDLRQLEENPAAFVRKRVSVIGWYSSSDGGLHLPGYSLRPVRLGLFSESFYSGELPGNNIAPVSNEWVVVEGVFWAREGTDKRYRGFQETDHYLGELLRITKQEPLKWTSGTMPAEYSTY